MLENSHFQQRWLGVKVLGPNLRWTGSPRWVFFKRNLGVLLIGTDPVLDSPPEFKSYESVRCFLDWKV